MQDHCNADALMDAAVSKLEGGDDGAVALVVSALRLFRFSATAALSGCAALACFTDRLSSDGAYSRAFPASSSASASASQSSPSSPGSASSPSSAAAARLHRRRLTFATVAGAVEELSLIMRAHGQSADIQREACNALWNLSADPHALRIATTATDTVSADCADTESTEALPVVLSALSEHRGNEGTVCAALGAASALLQSPAGAARGAALGAAERAVAAMGLHLQSERAQVLGSALLCYSPLRSSSVAPPGLVQACAAALRQHGRDSPCVAANCCAALAAACEHDAAAAERAVASGALPQVAAAMAAHPLSVSVQRRGGHPCAVRCPSLLSLSLSSPPERRHSSSDHHQSPPPHPGAGPAAAPFAPSPSAPPTAPPPSPPEPPSSSPPPSPPTATSPLPPPV